MRISQNVQSRTTHYPEQCDEGRDGSQEGESSQATLVGRAQSLVVDLGCRHEDGHQADPSQDKESEHKPLRAVQP